MRNLFLVLVLVVAVFGQFSGEKSFSVQLPYQTPNLFGNANISIIPSDSASIQVTVSVQAPTNALVEQYLNSALNTTGVDESQSIFLKIVPLSIVAPEVSPAKSQAKNNAALASKSPILSILTGAAIGATTQSVKAGVLSSMAMIATEWFSANAQTTVRPGASVHVQIRIPAAVSFNSVVLKNVNGSAKINDPERRLNILFPSCGVDLNNDNTEVNAIVCPRCCSGSNGECTLNGCACKPGFTGEDCSVQEPTYLKSKTGLPTTPLTYLNTIVIRGRRYLQVEDLTTKKSSIFVAIEATQANWVRLNYNFFLPATSNGVTNDIYFVGSNQLVRVSNDTLITNIAYEVLTTPANAPKDLDIAIINKKGSRIFIRGYGDTNPQFFYLDLNTKAWTNMTFPFRNLDGKPHVRILEGDDESFWYISNYSGTYGWDPITVRWTKPQNVVAPTWFKVRKGNPFLQGKIVKSTSPVTISTETYTQLNIGLPPVYTSRGLIECNGFLWMSVGKSLVDGLYQFDGARWWFVAASPVFYGMGNLGCINNLLFAESHNSLFRLDIDDNYSWIVVSQFFDGELGQLFPSKTRMLLRNGDNTNPIIREINNPTVPFTGAIVNLQFPFRDLDGKPHIQLCEDNNSNVWYESNYSGIFLYTRATQTWEKANNRSGAISMGADGAIYLSYEITPTTQIASFFLYQGKVNGEFMWKKVHSDQGYAIRGKAIGTQGHIFFFGNRFSEFMIHGTKKWTLPSMEDGLGLTDSEVLSSGCMSTTATTDGSVYCTQRYTQNNAFKNRVLAMKPNLTPSAYYYDSNLQISTGSFIAPGRAVATKIFGDNTILVALNADAPIAGATCLFSNCTGMKGVVVLLNADATQIIKSFVVGQTVLAASVSPSSSAYFVVATNTAILKVTISSGAIAFNNAFTSTTKAVSVAKSDRIIVLLDNNKVAAYESNGVAIWTKDFTRSYTTDVEIDSDNDAVFVVGYDNKKLPDGLPVQVAFFESYKISDGTLRWQRFAFDGNLLSRNIADTRLYKVKLGQDGLLYTAGESAGTETIFRFDGVRISGASNVTSIDFYNALWNTKSAHITYLARWNPVTGALLRSQLVMARLSSGLSNTYRMQDGDIDANARSELFQVGVSAFEFGNRFANSINGEAVGQYVGDPVMLWLQPNFRGRCAWSTFVKDIGATRNSGGYMNAVAARGNTAVVFGTINYPNAPTAFITSNAITKTVNVAASGNPVAYIAVMKTTRT